MGNNYNITLTKKAEKFIKKQENMYLMKQSKL